MQTKTVAAVGTVAVAVALATAQLLAPQKSNCQGSSVCLAWSASAGYDDGSKYAANAAVSYNLFRYDKARNTGVFLGSIAALKTQLDNQPVGQNCYFLSTVVDGSEGSYSNQACRTVIDAPSNGSIEDAK